jgi:hypothetical protein
MSTIQKALLKDIQQSFFVMSQTNFFHLFSYKYSFVQSSYALTLSLRKCTIAKQLFPFFFKFTKTVIQNFADPLAG